MIFFFPKFERSSRTFVRFRSSRLPQPARSVQFRGSGWAPPAAFVRVRSSRNPRELEGLRPARESGYKKTTAHWHDKGADWRGLAHTQYKERLTVARHVDLRARGALDLRGRLPQKRQLKKKLPSPNHCESRDFLLVFKNLSPTQGF